MSRYSSLLFIIEYLFMHYVILAGPAAVISIMAGLSITVMQLIISRFHFKKSHERILLVASLLPILIGIIGTAMVINSINMALSIEQKVGRPPSANKYYDLQYGYHKILLILFPFIVGIISSIPPYVTWLVAIRKKASAH